jgi:hypothetical protein
MSMLCLHSCNNHTLYFELILVCSIFFSCRSYLSCLYRQLVQDHLGILVTIGLHNGSLPIICVEHLMVFCRAVRVQNHPSFKTCLCKRHGIQEAPRHQILLQQILYEACFRSTYYLLFAISASRINISSKPCACTTDNVFEGRLQKQGDQILLFAGRCRTGGGGHIPTKVDFWCGCLLEGPWHLCSTSSLDPWFWVVARACTRSLAWIKQKA